MTCGAGPSTERLQSSGVGGEFQFVFQTPAAHRMTLDVQVRWLRNVLFGMACWAICAAVRVGVAAAGDDISRLVAETPHVEH